MTRRLSLLLAVVLAFGLVSLAVAQQQDQPSATSNPLIQLLQNKGVLTPQEAAAINQAPTQAEQQNRLTQLLYSKGIITQDEYQTTAAAQASRTWNSQEQGMWIQTAAHSSAGDPDAAVAAAPQAPPAPSVIPAVAPVRVLGAEPPKAGGMVPDINLGSGAKLKFYGFIKSTAAYDTSNPYNIDFVLPGLGGTANSTVPQAVPTGLTGASTIPGVGNADSGPNGSPSFYLKATSTRFGSNFEWPDLAGSSNTLTGRIEADFEGNYARSQNTNVGSVRSRMLRIRLAFVRLDHAFSDTTTGFALFGQDWAPFGSSTQANILETTGGMLYFGNIQNREAQFRFGLWHKFSGSRDFRIGIEPAAGFPGFGNQPGDVAEQLGVNERQGDDSGRPEVTGRLVFQWQLDKARGVAPAQLIFSGMNAKRVAIVNRAAIVAAECSASGSTTNAACSTAIIGNAVSSAPGFVAPANTLLGAFPNGAENSSQRWGADAEIQLPTRYMTLVAKYYQGADLKWYAGGQAFTAFNDNRSELLNTNAVNAAAAFTGVPCGVNGQSCPQVFDMDASAPNVFFGFNPVTDRWQLVPQHPTRAVGGLVQIAFPLSRIFDANPAGRNAGWTLAFTYGTDQAKRRDVLAQTATGAACYPGQPGSDFGSATACPTAGATTLPGALNTLGQTALSAGSRNRSDVGVATLVWRFNQFLFFNYESSIYLTRSTCVGTFQNTSTASSSYLTYTGVVPNSFAGESCSGTLFRGYPARYWHDLRNEFGPVITF